MVKLKEESMARYQFLRMIALPTMARLGDDHDASGRVQEARVTKKGGTKGHTGGKCRMGFSKY